MLTTTRKGMSPADMADQVRGVPARLIPYATATALTRCAKQAQTVELPQAMRKAFDNPTSYTLNALRIEPATKDKLSARVMVKTKADSSGNAHEAYLQPEVDGAPADPAHYQRYRLGVCGQAAGALAQL